MLKKLNASRQFDIKILKDTREKKTMQTCKKTKNEQERFTEQID